jgi:thiol-disulfide isomerase/thioredoxin
MQKPSWLRWGRVFDVLAVLVIAFVVWKVFFAPRMLKAADAYPAPRVAYPYLGVRSTFHIADARGHVLFLEFFESWCEPCGLEAPLVDHYARTHPEIDLVPVDIGEPPALAAHFANRFHMRNVALDPSGSARGFFQIEGTPTIVVIDPAGRIRATWAGFNPAIELAMSNAEHALQQ